MKKGIIPVSTLAKSLPAANHTVAPGPSAQPSRATSCAAKRRAPAPTLPHHDRYISHFADSDALSLHYTLRITRHPAIMS